MDYEQIERQAMFTDEQKCPKVNARPHTFLKPSHFIHFCWELSRVGISP